jgi:hypothetical protein
MPARRGARFMTGSLLRARQRALTALSPHNANDTHFIPNRGVTDVGGGGIGVGVDNLLLVESGDNILRVEDSSCVILRVE